MTPEQLQNLNSQLWGLAVKRKNCEDRVSAETRKLGVDDTAKLNALKDSIFVQQHVNAVALLSRIRQHMQARRYEWDRVERSYRTAVNGE